MLLVFDLDGTLVDSIHDLAEAASDLSEAYGGTRFDDETVCRMVGDGAAVLVERVLARAGHAASRLPAPSSSSSTLYDQRMFDTTRAYPGVADTLRALADTPRDGAADQQARGLGAQGAGPLRPRRVLRPHDLRRRRVRRASRTRPACAG